MKIVVLTMELNIHAVVVIKHSQVAAFHRWFSFSLRLRDDLTASSRWDFSPVLPSATNHSSSIYTTINFTDEFRNVSVTHATCLCGLAGWAWWAWSTHA